MPSNELLKRFRIIGRHAYEDGAIRLARQDPQVNAAIVTMATMSTGICAADIMHAWLAGWDDAQMDDHDTRRITVDD